MLLLNPDEYISGNVLIIPQSIIPFQPKQPVIKQDNPNPGDGAENTDTGSEKSSIEIPEGFVSKDFRLLSETYLWNIFGLCDYTLPGVIQNSMTLFPQTLSVFKDHWWSVDSIVGYSTGFRYGKLENLAGIDANLLIDTQVDPKTARNVQTGAANRCSLTLATRLEKSHPNMRTDVFYDTMGEEVDGEIVRWKVTEILEYFEVSLVWYGADSTAVAHVKQKIDHYKAISKNIFPVSVSQTRDKTEVNMDPEIKQLMELVNSMGYNVVTPTQLRDALTQISNDNKALKTQNAQLEAQVNEYKPGHEKFQAIAEGVRTDITQMMKVLSGKTKDEELDALEMQVIKNAGYDQLVKIQKQKNEQMEKMVPLKCPNCGETNVARRSSLEVPIQNQEPTGPGMKPIGMK